LTISVTKKLTIRSSWWQP